MISILSKKCSQSIFLLCWINKCHLKFEYPTSRFKQKNFRCRTLGTRSLSHQTVKIFSHFLKTKNYYSCNNLSCNLSKRIFRLPFLDRSKHFQNSNLLFLQIHFQKTKQDEQQKNWLLVHNGKFRYNHWIRLKFSMGILTFLAFPNEFWKGKVWSSVSQLSHKMGQIYFGWICMQYALKTWRKKLRHLLNFKTEDGHFFNSEIP